MINRELPTVIFKTRVRDESVEGDNPFKWENKSTENYFGNKKVVIFSLPALLLPHARLSSFPITTSYTVNLARAASIRFFVFR